MARSHVSAWREILARIFEGLAVEYNVTPPWLINPSTKRPLKIDLLYPDIGVAIRLSGLRGSQQKGPVSLDERAQQQARDRARHQVSAKHGISLADLNVSHQEPDAVFETLELALSRASRRLKNDETHSAETQTAGLTALTQARGKAWQLRRKVQTQKDLNLYHELWCDRQVRETEASISTSESVEPLPSLSVGMAVEHVHFGPGLVETITPGNTPDDTLVTIYFETDESRTFMVNLLAGKLTAI